MTKPSTHSDNTATYWRKKHMSATNLGQIKINNYYTVDLKNMLDNILQTPGATAPNKHTYNSRHRPMAS